MPQACNCIPEIGFFLQAVFMEILLLNIKDSLTYIFVLGTKIKVEMMYIHCPCNLPQCTRTYR